MTGAVQRLKRSFSSTSVWLTWGLSYTSSTAWNWMWTVTLFPKLSIVTSITVTASSLASHTVALRKQFSCAINTDISSLLTFQFYFCGLDTAQVLWLKEYSRNLALCYHKVEGLIREKKNHQNLNSRGRYTFSLCESSSKDTASYKSHNASLLIRKPPW